MIIHQKDLKAAASIMHALQLRGRTITLDAVIHASHGQVVIACDTSEASIAVRVPADGSESFDVVTDAHMIVDMVKYMGSGPISVTYTDETLLARNDGKVRRQMVIPTTPWDKDTWPSHTRKLLDSEPPQGRTLLIHDGASKFEGLLLRNAMGAWAEYFFVATGVDDSVIVATDKSAMAFIGNPDVVHEDDVAAALMPRDLMRIADSLFGVVCHVGDNQITLLGDAGACNVAIVHALPAALPPIAAMRSVLANIVKYQSQAHFHGTVGRDDLMAMIQSIPSGEGLAGKLVLSRDTLQLQVDAIDGRTFVADIPIQGEGIPVTIEDPLKMMRHLKVIAAGTSPITVTAYVDIQTWVTWSADDMTIAATFLKPTEEE